MKDAPNTFYDPERAILGAMVLDKSVFIEYNHAIKPEFFGHPQCKELYKFMLKSYSTLKEWDVIVFDNYVPSGQPTGYLEWCDLYKSKEGVKEYIKIVSLRYISRQLEEDKQLPAEMKIEQVSQFIEDFRKIEVVTEEKSTEALFQAASDKAANAFEDGIELAYPYKMLTKRLGGLYREEVTLIIGGTSQSKTVFLHNCLRPSLQAKKKILIYDFELPEIPIVQRLCAMCMKIPLDWMKNGETLGGQKLSEKQTTLMLDYMSGLRDVLKETVIIKGPSTLSQIEADIASHKPDIVTIDTIQAMTDVEPIKRGEAESSQLARIASGLQMFAKKYKIAVLEVAQVTKENQTTIPKIGDIYGSSVIGTKAANIIAVRDRHMCTKEKDDLDVYDVVIRKSRHGQIGGFRFYMSKEIAHIDQSSKIENIEQSLEKGL